MTMLLKIYDFMEYFRKRTEQKKSKGRKRDNGIESEGGKRNQSKNSKRGDESPLN